MERIKKSMKKLLIITFSALLFSACSGSGSTENNNESTQEVSPQMQEIQKSSNDVKNQSEELNQKADSLLNNI